MKIFSNVVTHIDLSRTFLSGLPAAVQASCVHKRRPKPILLCPAKQHSPEPDFIHKLSTNFAHSHLDIIPHGEPLVPKNAIVIGDTTFRDVIRDRLLFFMQFHLLLANV